ncbi:probable diguanylate phosphodiesterase [gamma proteobacterium HdN1]|nr:probable diguanylate phosphodiesterase [gamma proteobacterium HdN1]
MNIFLARQPIFDRNLCAVGYELLYRAGAENSAAGMPEGSAATMQVLVNAFSEIGLENITSGLPALVNITQSMLSQGLLPKGLQKLLIPEVLEDVLVNSNVTQEVKNLLALGYRVALDDFVYATQWNPLIPLASFIKLDVRALTPAGVEEQLALLNSVADVSGKLLAEKVETHEEYELYRNMGFDFFQGYFLCKPQIMSGRSIPASYLVILSLLAELANDDYDVRRVEQLICQDPRLSYKLLRVVNSASFGFARSIKNIGETVIVLGAYELRRWAGMLALSNVDSKPNELVVTAIVRAKMCELLAARLNYGEPSTCFTAGLLSLLDALLDQPMQALVEKIPLSSDLESALLERSGKIGRLLSVVEAYEAGRWQDPSSNTLSNPFTADILLESYMGALQWSETLKAALFH